MVATWLIPTAQRPVAGNTKFSRKDLFLASCCVSKGEHAKWRLTFLFTQYETRVFLGLLMFFMLLCFFVGIPVCRHSCIAPSNIKSTSSWSVGKNLRASTPRNSKHCSKIKLTFPWFIRYFIWKVSSDSWGCNNLSQLFSKGDPCSRENWYRHEWLKLHNQLLFKGLIQYIITVKRSRCYSNTMIDNEASQTSWQDNRKIIKFYLGWKWKCFCQMNLKEKRQQWRLWRGSLIELFGMRDFLTEKSEPIWSV